MKLKPLFTMSMVAFSLGCAGVATENDVNSVYSRQVRLENRVNQLTQDLEKVRREAQDPNDVAMLREQIAQIEEKLRNLDIAYSELKEGYNRLSRPVPPPPPPVAPGDETRPVPPPPPVSENQVYMEAYKNLGEGKYEKSREQFKLFLRRNANSKDAPSASYWIAESYYREGRFEEAILEFQKFIDTYPKDERIPLSYLKQGLSLINIKRDEEAKLFLQTLIDKYPQSEEARVAKEKLKELARKN